VEKFTKKIYEFEFEGKTHQLNGMTMREAEALSEQDGTIGLKKQREILVGLGLNEDTYYQLSPDQLSIIVEGLIGGKKK
jgi:hypothetical protein